MLSETLCEQHYMWQMKDPCAIVQHTLCATREEARGTLGSAGSEDALNDSACSACDEKSKECEAPVAAGDVVMWALRC